MRRSNYIIAIFFLSMIFMSTALDNVKIEYANPGLNHPEVAQGPLLNSGPLQASSPLQSSGPLMGSGPLQSTTPIQYQGPMVSPLIDNDQYNLDHLLGDTIFRPYTINFELYEQQISELLSTADSATLEFIVDRAISNPNVIIRVTPLPPVIYNPSYPSYSSPN